MAERTGFEPVNGLPRYFLSREALSATQPPLPADILANFFKKINFLF